MSRAVRLDWRGAGQLILGAPADPGARLTLAGLVPGRAVGAMGRFVHVPILTDAAGRVRPRPGGMPRRAAVRRRSARI